MSLLRKGTETLRETLTQDIRYVLSDEQGVPDHFERRVTLLFPASPIIALAVLPYMVRIGNQIQVANLLSEFSVQPNAQMLNTPNDFGLNRLYKLPQWQPNGPVRLRILPHQSIVAASTDGLADFTIVVEYLTPHPHQ